MFKKQLKTFLHDRKLTAAEVARRTGVPKQTLSDWLSGTQPRNMEYVRRVAEELHVTTTQLFFDVPQLKEDEKKLADLKEKSITLNSMQHYCDFFFGNAIALMHIVDLRTGYPNILSPSWEKTLGWPRSDLMKKKWIDLVHPEDRSRVKSVVQKNASAQVSICEHRLLQSKGGYVHVFTKLAVDTAAQIMTSVSLPSEVYQALSQREKADFLQSMGGAGPVQSKRQGLPSV